jgi:hypothetical protein
MAISKIREKKPDRSRTPEQKKGLAEVVSPLVFYGVVGLE